MSGQIANCAPTLASLRVEDNIKFATSGQFAERMCHLFPFEVGVLVRQHFIIALRTTSNLWMQAAKAIFLAAPVEGHIGYTFVQGSAIICFQTVL